MLWRTDFLACVVAVLMASFATPNAARACGMYLDLDDLAVEAVSSKPETAKRAIALLRASGPGGLEALMTAHRQAIERHRANPMLLDQRWERIAAALDAVAAQKDAWAAGLYWYTDLEQAKLAAAALKRPILSLRLLGTLDTEFSCANSRFFRTVLYANADLSKHLRENFILHWKSHRPVPKLTIDFGDGRVIERTITGNSVHYVLAPDGRVVDVLPGLYGPAAFARALDAAAAVAHNWESTAFEMLVQRHHRQRLAETRQAWALDLKKVRPEIAARLIEAAKEADRKSSAPKAARIAPSKSAMELAPVLAIVPQRGALASAMDDQAWAEIAALHLDEARLDAGSRAVMASKAAPDAVEAGARALSKRRQEDPLVRLVRSFERSVAEDTVRNEYLLHAQVHEWFINGEAPQGLDDLNEKVYAQLFLMPRSDPWLGLVPADAYTALPGEATVRR